MRKNQRAFTLLEIMIVVSIIAVLLSLAIYKLKGNLEASKGVAVESDIQSIRTQLKVYESFNGFLPTTEQGLQALVTRPSSEPQPSRWTQLFDSVPKDPWHSDYIYLNPGRKNPTGYDLYSAGPDRIPDTGDDDWGGM
jgi:general secretion pathway protein G